MIDIFDMCAAPLRALLENEEISAEIFELFIAALAWFVPVVVLVVLVWAAVRMLGAIIDFAGGVWR